MSSEKHVDLVDETNHGITAPEDIHYPVVAEGTGKTLDEKAGAKAKEVHNVSAESSSSLTGRLRNLLATIMNSFSLTLTFCFLGRIVRSCPGVAY